MKEVKQTKLYDPSGTRRGNCFAAVIASILECDIAEVPNVETLFEIPDQNLWLEVINKWLAWKGFEWHTIQKEHIKADEFYLCVGKSERGVMHVCIYKNGSLFFDPHPSNSGLLTEEFFEVIEPV